MVTLPPRDYKLSELEIDSKVGGRSFENLRIDGCEEWNVVSCLMSLTI